MATENEIQSMLLRLSILLATSLKTLSERLPHNIASDPSSSSNFIGSGFQSQVLNDINVLLGNIQKACTNLTLALRKEISSQEDFTGADTISPTSGLDGPSLDAAAAQLEDLTRDFVPKLTWLSRKASSEANLLAYVPKSEEEKKREAKSRELLKAQGGFVVERGSYKDNEKLERIKGRGIGLAWSKSIKSVVIEVLAALGDLGEAFMSNKTKEALRRASEARSKVEGSRFNSILKREDDSSLQQARQRALQATAIVWKVCEAAVQGKLPKTNKEAVIRNWKVKSETLQDALRELKEAIQEKTGISAGEQGDSENQQDEFDLSETILSPDEKKRAEEMEEMIRSACQLFAKAGAIASNKEEIEVDFDSLDQAGETFVETVDFLVESVLEGEEVFDSDEENSEAGDDQELREGQKMINRNIAHFLTAIRDFSAILKGEFVEQIASIESRSQTLLLR